jgi:hypothetical protein
MDFKRCRRRLGEGHFGATLIEVLSKARKLHGQTRFFTNGSRESFLVLHSSQQERFILLRFRGLDCRGPSRGRFLTSTTT